MAPDVESVHQWYKKCLELGGRTTALPVLALNIIQGITALLLWILMGGALKHVFKVIREQRDAISFPGLKRSLSRPVEKVIQMRWNKLKLFKFYNHPDYFCKPIVDLMVKYLH